MLTVLYRWKIRSGFERQFVDCWSEITLYYRENHGSYGSRLHRGNDGLFYGYAMWPSLEQRNEAFGSGFEHSARAGMVEAIEESFAETLLEVEADLLRSDIKPLDKSE